MERFAFLFNLNPIHLGYLKNHGTFISLGDFSSTRPFLRFCFIKFLILVSQLSCSRAMERVLDLQDHGIDDYSGYTGPILKIPSPQRPHQPGPPGDHGDLEKFQHCQGPAKQQIIRRDSPATVQIIRRDSPAKQLLPKYKHQQDPDVAKLY